MVIQKYFQRLGVSGVVEREQLLVKLLHVLFLHRQHPRARPQKDLAGQRETCALVAVPEKPAPCSPCKRIECFFGCARVGVQNSGERRAALYFVRNRRQIIRAGYTDLSRAQFAPHKRLIPCDVFVQLAEVFQRQRHIHGIEQKTPGIAHIEDSLNIVELRARNVHAVQNRARLRESHCPVFHLHAAIDILIPLFLQETGFVLRSYEIYPYTFYVHRPMSPDKKENPAEPCTLQKKTLHSKAVSAALLCASNIRCGRAAREACIPTEQYRIPFYSCRFRYGCVSRAKQESLLSVYACARDLCAQFSLLSPSAFSS